MEAFIINVRSSLKHPFMSSTFRSFTVQHRPLWCSQIPQEPQHSTLVSFDAVQHLQITLWTVHKIMGQDKILNSSLEWLSLNFWMKDGRVKIFQLQLENLISPRRSEASLTWPQETPHFYEVRFLLRSRLQGFLELRLFSHAPPPLFVYEVQFFLQSCEKSLTSLWPQEKPHFY